MAITDFNLKTPMPDIFPKEWRNCFGEGAVYNFMEFRNLSHFKYEVSQLKQINDDSCGVSYAKAVQDLNEGVSNFPESEQESIRNLVRENLYKRGLITEEVYENYKYTTDGVQVGIDVGKYAAGEPDCVITPNSQYVDFFYELYISISYPWSVPDSKVRKNVAKLLATIEELERRHVFIKVTLIFPDMGCDSRGGSFLSTIPLFSHKDQKSVAIMSSVVNERLLRKFYFAILETVYAEHLVSGYGRPLDLHRAMNIGGNFNEIDFYKKVIESVGA